MYLLSFLQYAVKFFTENCFSTSILLFQYKTHSIKYLKIMFLIFLKIFGFVGQVNVQLKKLNSNLIYVNT